jgi:FKBP-type peptidyl-prolyl cis-trans isomerase FkpA
MRAPLGRAVFAAAALFVTNAQAQALKTEEEKTIYALGLSIGESVRAFHLSRAELEILRKGMADALAGTPPKVTLDEYGPKISELVRAREKRFGAEFLAKAAKQKGAVKLPSGLLLIPQAEGEGEPPKSTDRVKVHYRGTLIDGTEFDSSHKRGQPAEFPLSGVIACWTEGMQQLKPGGKAKLVCPSDIAYGDTGRPPKIPPGATLVFDVELLEVVRK